LDLFLELYVLIRLLVEMYNILLLSILFLSKLSGNSMIMHKFKRNRKAKVGRSSVGMNGVASDGLRERHSIKLKLNSIKLKTIATT
jgi:hypothetical protein